MTRHTIKPHLCNRVRQLFELQEENKMYFTREEMINMVTQITNRTPEDLEWEGVADFMEEELTHLGWEPQETVDTHPNIVNLNFLIEQKQKKIAEKAVTKFKRERIKKETEQKTKTHQNHDVLKTENTQNTLMFENWVRLLNTISLHPKKMTVYENKIEFLF